MNDSLQWHKAMDLDDLWEGDLVGISVGSTDVLLIQVDGQVIAYEDRCPHQATKLSEGDLDGGVLICTSHLWEFDACSGSGINPSTACLVQFPARVEDGIIFVALPGA